MGHGCPRLLFLFHLQLNIGYIIKTGYHLHTTNSIYSNIILIKTETMDARTKTPDYIQTLCALYINLIHIVGSPKQKRWMQKLI